MMAKEIFSKEMHHQILNLVSKNCIVTKLEERGQYIFG